LICLPVKQYLNHRLTPAQAVLVVVLAAALAGAGYFAWGVIDGKIFQAQVRAAVPQVCAALRDQRRQLLAAIEAYKNEFGFYPPDNVLSHQPLVVDAVNNPLVYELADTVYNPTNQMFSLSGLEPAEAGYVTNFFHCDGFKNCGPSANQTGHFLPHDSLPVRQLHDDPDVFVLGPELLYDQFPEETLDAIHLSPWRYVSSSPTNNPAKFDLWIELETKDQKVTIGNWTAVE
jgi:hypothetical protein